jgi:hypothetical protein
MAVKPARRSVPKAGRSTRSRRPGKSIVVTEEERCHLIDDIAYFHAERYRVVGAGGCRDQDRQRAATEVDAVLKRRRKR